MSDLINRGNLLDEVQRLEELARSRVLDTPTESPCYMRYVAQMNERTAMKHLIADAPTAYDVDKVVEQLENKIFSAEVHNDDFNGVQIDNLLCMGDVYEIVKAGGEGE